MADNARQGKRVADNDLMGYVALRAPKGVTLELSEVIVLERPRSR